MRKTKEMEKSERGGAGVKMTVALVILFLIGYAGYNYIPVAYQGQNFKQDMQTAVLQGMAVTGGLTAVDMVKGKVQRAMMSDEIPTDAVLQVKQTSNAVEARVFYTKRVPILPFGIYTYNYSFDHTATPTGFLLKD